MFRSEANILLRYGYFIFGATSRLQAQEEEREARLLEEMNCSVALHRLPNELLVIIFEYAIIHDEEGHSRLGPVCRKWRALVNDTQSLWSTIHADLTGFTSARAHRPLYQFPTRISKSGGTALDLKIIFGDRRTATVDSIHETIYPHLGRCKKLELQAGGDAQPLVFSLPEMLPALEDLTLAATTVIVKQDIRKKILRDGHLPPLLDFPPLSHSRRLQSLHLQGPFAAPCTPIVSPNLTCLILRHHVFADVHHFIAFFQNCPFLETVTLHVANTRPPTSSDPTYAEPVALPTYSHSTLRVLIVESFETISWLTLLSSPSLERIEYRLSSIRDGVRVIGMLPHKSLAKYAKVAFPNLKKWDMTATKDPDAGFLSEAGVSRGSGV